MWFTYIWIYVHLCMQVEFDTRCRALMVMLWWWWGVHHHHAHHQHQGKCQQVMPLVVSVVSGDCCGFCVWWMGTGACGERSTYVCCIWWWLFYIYIYIVYGWQVILHLVVYSHKGTRINCRDLLSRAVIPSHGSWSPVMGRDLQSRIVIPSHGSWSQVTGRVPLL